MSRCVHGFEQIGSRETCPACEGEEAERQLRAEIAGLREEVARLKRGRGAATRRAADAVREVEQAREESVAGWKLFSKMIRAASLWSTEEVLMKRRLDHERENGCLLASIIVIASLPFRSKEDLVPFSERIARLWGQPLPGNLDPVEVRASLDALANRIECEAASE